MNIYSIVAVYHQEDVVYISGIILAESRFRAEEQAISDIEDRKNLKSRLRLPEDTHLFSVQYICTLDEAMDGDLVELIHI